MGLDFNYRIYVKKDKLEDAFKLVAANCSKNNGIVYQDGKFFKNYSYKALEPLDILKLNVALSCVFMFKKDDQILAYSIKNNINVLRKETDEKNYFSIKDIVLPVGGIDVSVIDYGIEIPDTFEIRFAAVTSDMSRLFRDSPSIEAFFKRFCQEVKADYGCLDKEHEGYRLIWFEGEPFSVDLPHEYGYNDPAWEPFRELCFIPAMRRFAKEEE